MARILGWTNLQSAPLHDFSLDFWINNSSDCEMHHVSFELISFFLNDCATSPGRRQYHWLIFATFILDDKKTLLSLTKFPIVHRRQDFSQSTPTTEDGASPATVAKFSLHTCRPTFIGMTSDHNDILVSLSPNLKRYFSRPLLMDARSFNQEVQILLETYLIPSSSLHNQCRQFLYQDRNTTLPRTHNRHDCVPASTSLLFPAENNVVHDVCESCQTANRVYQRNTGIVVRSQGSSHRSTPLSSVFFRIFSFSRIVFHLLCDHATIFADILSPTVPHVHIDCTSFSVSALPLLLGISASRRSPLTSDGFPNPRRSLSFDISCRFCFHAVASTSRTPSLVDENFHNFQTINARVLIDILLFFLFDRPFRHETLCEIFD